MVPVSSKEMSNKKEAKPNRVNKIQAEEKAVREKVQSQAMSKAMSNLWMPDNEMQKWPETLMHLKSRSRQGLMIIDSFIDLIHLSTNYRLFLFLFNFWANLEFKNFRISYFIFFNLWESKNQHRSILIGPNMVRFSRPKKFLKTHKIPKYIHRSKYIQVKVKR